MLIEFSEVSKGYRSVVALQGVSLSIDPGQIISVLGPNGAGKTTALRCLAGIAMPDTGDIYFDGQPFSRERLDLRKRLHFLPDFPPHFWDQSVLRNIAITLRLYGADGPGSEQRVLELLREFDLLPLAFRTTQALSRGQSYKVALVALIATDPELWLLDEPFASGMDPNGINAFKRHAKEAAARGRTILYTTQLLDVAERFSSRACVLHKGAVRAFDSIDRLRESARDKDNVLDEMFQSLRETAA